MSVVLDMPVFLALFEISKRDKKVQLRYIRMAKTRIHIKELIMHIDSYVVII